jgi:hypothetical protein
MGSETLDNAWNMAKELTRISFVQRNIIDWPQNEMMPMRKIALEFVLNEDLRLRQILNVQVDIRSNPRSKFIPMEQATWDSVSNMVEMLSRTSNLLQSISRWLPTEVIRKRA